MSTARRPPVTRAERVVERLRKNGDEDLTVSLLTLATVGLLFGGAYAAAAHVVLLAVALFATLVVLVALSLTGSAWLARTAQRMIVEITAGYQTVQSLDTTRQVWDELPPHVQEQTRDVINAAYQAATLPRGAQHAVEQRLRLLRGFKDRVEREAEFKANQLLGEDDLEHGRALLAALDEVWAAQVPYEVPAQTTAVRPSLLGDFKDLMARRMR